MPGAVALVVLVVALVGFAVVALRGGPAGGVTADTYLSARGSQRSWPLAVSLYASGMGVWILLTPPLVAAATGIAGVVAYTVAAGAPLVALAVLGPRVRRSLPEGITLTDWVRQRHGAAFAGYVAVVAVFYMVMFTAAELTAIGAVLSLPALGGLPVAVGVVATAVVTVAYTAWGGLPASIRTDGWQGWLVGLGVAAVVVAVATGVDAPVDAAVAGGLTSWDPGGFEAIGVLVIALTAANLFHQGYWQRLWAARDAPSLRRAALVAAAASAVTVFVVALGGLVAAGTGEVSVPLFDLVGRLPVGVRVGVVVLVVALVASSVDTLLNATTAVVVTDVSRGRLGVGSARWVTAALVVPAAVIATQGYDILRLFLIADLVAAATVVPVFAGLGRRLTGAGAIAGSVGGLVAVFVWGVVDTGGVAGGFGALTVAGSPTLDLGAFVVAVVASAVVAFAVAATQRAWAAAAAKKSRSSSMARR